MKEDIERIKLYLLFINDLTLSGILPKFAALIKAECERTGKSALEVIDEGLKSGPKALKMKFSAAMQIAGFSARESSKTVEELFRRLAKSSFEPCDNSQTGTGKSLPECDIQD